MLYEFGVLPEKFHSAVWGIQMTPDIPTTSLEDLADFYIAKIKEKQPRGPYRLGGYSGSNILAVLMALKLESRGEEVSQLALLDHFPTCLSYSTNILGNPDPETDRSARFRAQVEIFLALFRLDSTRNDERTIGGFSNAFDDPNSASLILQLVVKNVKIYMRLVDRFLYDLATVNPGGLLDLEKVQEWLRRVKAPLSVYVAKKGVRCTVLEADREEWEDLGARRAVPNAEVIYVEGGHYEFLWDPLLIDRLQRGY